MEIIVSWNLLSSFFFMISLAAVMLKKPSLWMRTLGFFKVLIQNLVSLFLLRESCECGVCTFNGFLHWVNAMQTQSQDIALHNALVFLKGKEIQIGVVDICQCYLLKLLLPCIFQGKIILSTFSEQ